MEIANKKGKKFPLSELLEWFSVNKRDLPWRQNPSFYQVLISEVMLQQTQVATVIPYFHKWMEKFPTFYHLSRAPLEQIIKSWEGLGYYSRARNLHKLAKIIDETQNLTTNETEDIPPNDEIKRIVYHRS